MGFIVMFSYWIISSTVLVSVGAIRIHGGDFAVARVILLARRRIVSDERVVSIKGRGVEGGCEFLVFRRVLGLAWGWGGC